MVWTRAREDGSALLMWWSSLAVLSTVQTLNLVSHAHVLYELCTTSGSMYFAPVQARIGVFRYLGSQQQMDFASVATVEGTGDLWGAVIFVQHSPPRGWHRAPIQANPADCFYLTELCEWSAPVRPIPRGERQDS
jgi:hypothetical protein